MCTLIVARNLFKGYPVVIAANRDEALDRPASPPRIWDGSPAILAPVDELAGGTWIGVSERGVIAAVTNLHDVPTAAGKESRGTLVLAALEASDARRAAESVSHLNAASFNGFHLVVMDKDGAFLLRGNGTTIETAPLPDGLNVITQFGTGPDGERAAKIRARYLVYLKDSPPRPLSLNTLLAIHDGGNGMGGSCVHMPNRRYGTRSSTIIRMADDAKGVDYWHREGPACKDRFGEPIRFDFRR